MANKQSRKTKGCHSCLKEIGNRAQQRHHQVHSHIN